MSDSILSLPAEMRLEVYRQLITVCMTDGNIAGISGLLFSYRKIFDEMCVKCIPKVRLVLETIREWQDAHPYGGSLQIELPRDYEYVGLLTEAIIALPVSETWMNTVSSLGDKMPFQETVASLVPLLCQPWSNLKLHISFLSAEKKDDKYMYRMSRFRGVYGGLLDVMLKNHSAPGRPTLFAAVKRLVVYADELKRVFKQKDVEELEDLVQWAMITLDQEVLRVHRRGHLCTTRTTKRMQFGHGR
jgi:hypothetical protein